MIDHIDIVQDLMFGDSGKGKVTHHLLKNESFLSNKSYFDICLRTSGGSNAGHTIWHSFDGGLTHQKFVTHIIPAGVFYGVKSIIGNGCFINPDKLFEEIQYLENNGIKCRDLIKIAKNAHIVTKKHLEEDGKETKIGTTKQGMGPCARDKYNRTGIQAKDVSELSPFIIDLYDEFFVTDEYLYILVEGSQGFYLDIENYGDTYPYVTSSHCSVAGALLNYLPHNRIVNVWGVIKCYTTYVGTRKFQPEGKIFEQIQEAGGEYGATTGRKRQVNWLDINMLKKAIDINGVNILVINKMDVLREIGSWNVINNGQIINLYTEEGFKNYITEYFSGISNIIFSDRPDRL